MDWGKCALCQEDDIDLLDPLQNKNSDVDGYSKLAANIESFLNKNVPLPAKCTTSLVDLKGDSNIASTLRNVKAKWHKRCALEISSSKLKRALSRKEKESDISLETPSKQLRKSFTPSSPLGSPMCFDKSGVFYDEETQPSNRMNKEEKSRLLHRVKTFARDVNIREAATQIGDIKVLAKLSEEDMMAREACYHKSCMDSFANRHQSFVNKKAKSNGKSQQNHESIALAEAMIYIEETLQEDNTEVAPFIKLSTARKYYQSCLTAINVKFTTVNLTRLKKRILSLRRNIRKKRSVHFL